MKSYLKAGLIEQTGVDVEINRTCDDLLNVEAVDNIAMLLESNPKVPKTDQLW